MPSSIRERLEKAIREEDERSLRRLEISHEVDRGTELEFEPVRQAAEEVREQLQFMPSIGFTINPSDVWISLADRDLWIGYDHQRQRFVGKESAHSWYDGELYADSYEWETDEACVEAMIRLCARYVRMARTIGGSEL